MKCLPPLPQLFHFSSWRKYIFFSFLFTWKNRVIYNSFFRPQRDHRRRHSWFLVAALKWDTTKLIDSTCPNHCSCWNLCILSDSLLSRLSHISILLRKPSYYFSLNTWQDRSFPRSLLFSYVDTFISVSRGTTTRVLFLILNFLDTSTLDR